MKLARLIPAILLACLATPALAQNAPTRVAIANPAKIFNELQETRDLQAKFNNDLSALNVQKKEKELKLNDTKSARDAVKPDSTTWVERNDELLRLAVDYEVWQRITQAELERQQKTQMKLIFDKITESIGQVATGKGIDLVIAEVRPDLPESLDQIQVNDLRARLVSRNVLFNAPGVDISNDVIAAMDAKYKSGK